MNSIKRVGLLAGAATLTVTATALAGTNTGGETEVLRAEIAQLKADMAKLQANTNDNWLSEQRAAELRGLVADAVADADSRASLLQSGMTGGWNNGFMLASPDNNFLLKIKGQIQARYAYNYIDSDGVGADTNRAGFENSRVKLKFGGHVVNPDWTYYIQTNGNASSSGDMRIEDAWIGYTYGDSGWTVRVGQFKAPLLRETLVSSTKQLAVDRSLVEGAFGGGRTQGIWFNYNSDQFRFHGAYTDGAGMTNGDAMMEDTEYAFTLRGEFLFSGSWKQFDDFTSFQEDAQGFMLGGAVHYQDGEYGTALTETELLVVTVDGSMEWGGANLYGAFIYNSVDDEMSVDADRYGFVLQGGVFVDPTIEIFGRFEYGDEDATGVDELMLLTFGVNKYFSKHQVKWTTDVGYAIDGVTSTFASDSKEWRTSGENDDQIVFRTQLQLLF